MMQRPNRLQRGAVARGVGHVNHRRLDQADDRLELGEVAGLGGVGGRHRSHGNANVHPRERQQSLLDAVVGENCDRPLRADVLEQPGCESADPVAGLGIGGASPGAIDTFEKKGAIRRSPGPVFQPLTDRAVAGAQWLGRAEQNCPVWPAIHVHGRTGKSLSHHGCDSTKWF
jgi:hypothetical protein